MTPFTRLQAPAAALLEDNIDTDVIFPARFLLLLDKAGLGRHAFHDRRYTPVGEERAAFVLNQPTHRHTQILLAGANFGSGSSREQAVWCLVDFGIRCVIAPSFGDIFAANCVNNGVLPVALPKATVEAFAQTGLPLDIDLEAQTIACPSHPLTRFDIAPGARTSLLNGWDSTQRIIQTQQEKIAAFETRHRDRHAWLFPNTGD